ncbi:Rha family transcriptional regulator [Chromobacterium haemolyticum]|uniref:Rha family transcriptional regulator n=1 Tax=Chromobacterium haemolyticum TaxID=394935 RepID=UPI0040561FE4
MNELSISNFNDFVMQAGDQVVTDSRRVAKAFGKRHGDVLRSISGMLKGKNAQIREFAQRNFALSFEINKLANGRKDKFYAMTKDGFLELAMSFTGETARLIRIQFIDAFNAMADFIRQKQTSTWKEYQAVAIEFAKGRDTASLCGRGLRRWRSVKSGLKDRMDKLEHEIQPQLLLN